MSIFFNGQEELITDEFCKKIGELEIGRVQKTLSYKDIIKIEKVNQFTNFLNLRNVQCLLVCLVQMDFQKTQIMT